MALRPPDGRPIGQAWLRERLALRVPAPAVQSFIVQGARRTEVHDGLTMEFYPPKYGVDDTVVANLRFALKHEPFDLGVVVAACKAIEPAAIEAWVRAEPSGAFSRRAWFLYETFVGQTLDLDNVHSGVGYVDALDDTLHIVGASRKSSRHRVNDNLLGGRGLCPTVRRTGRLDKSIGLEVDNQARALIQDYDPLLLIRAVNYLYTKETRSSFEIEGEQPGASRTERFAAALKAAASFDSGDKSSLVRLQGEIVDPRYAAKDWRDFQNFIGESLGDHRENVHFICPRPADVESLMTGWMALTKRLLEGTIDPVIAAAVSAFSFVFIHPFEDGNGRIHRFLMHHVLAQRGFSPANIVFPVSAAILRDRATYDAVLESFSRPLFECIDWQFNPDVSISVTNDTGHLYRYFDATRFAEYLYDRVMDTVKVDLREELGFVALHDRAAAAVRELVDMPDRRLSLFVRLLIQNGGTLSMTKRTQFEELTDDEVAALEQAVKAAMAGGHAEP